MFPVIRNQIKSDKSREHNDKVVSLVVGIIFDTGLASFGRVHDMFPKWISFLDRLFFIWIPPHTVYGIQYRVDDVVSSYQHSLFEDALSLLFTIS